MTTTTKTQNRGICQCCGREQAVLSSGLMSKHGYTVEHGWFAGVCTGQNYEPLQISRVQADRICAQVAADCDGLEARVAGLRDGSILPEMAPSYMRDPKGGTIRVPYAEAHKWHQEEAVRSDIYRAEVRARAGRDFVAHLQALADATLGQPLRIVPIADGPAPVLSGERRMSERGRILTVRYVRGARVEWTDERGFRGWTGIQAWRRMAMAPAAEAVAA